MNWMEFVSSLVGSVIWPVTILVAVLLLRPPLDNLLPFIEKLRYKDFELFFSRRVEEIRAEVSDEFPDPTGDSTQSEKADRVAQLAMLSPRAAVIHAWLEVEAAVRSAARRLGYDKKSGRVDRVIDWLKRVGRLDRGMASLLDDLRQLRNQAAHVPETVLSEAAAIEYAKLATRVSEFLEDMGTYVDDVEPPTLLSFDIVSRVVHKGPASVELRAHIVDELSGVAGRGYYPGPPTQVRFLSPSRRQAAIATFRPDRDLETGTAQDGRYRTVLNVPENAEPGRWFIDSFLLVDQSGNSAALSADEMKAREFPTTFEVLQ